MQLSPNNRQNTRLFQMSGVSRFAYNWALTRQKENCEQGNNFIKEKVLRREFTQLKSQKEYKWLNNISNNVPKQAIRDLFGAYVNFFDGRANYPKYKTKRKSKPSFYQDTAKINFTKTHVKLEKISLSQKKNKKKLNWIRLKEKDRIPFGEGVKYFDPRLNFDGLNWWITVGVEHVIDFSLPQTEGIGMDLGVNELAITSDNDVFDNINKSKIVRKIEKKKRRLQRKVSRKYQYNKKGERYVKTCNIIKSEKEILKLYKRLTNIRHNYIHQITTTIANRKPKFVVMEDLNVGGMMKNKHLSKVIQQQKFYEFRRIMEYKCHWNNIDFILADRFFPSSKLCRCCGSIKKDLRLKDRTYNCPCGNVIDRDYQAALNLKQYGEGQLQSAS